MSSASAANNNNNNNAQSAQAQIAAAQAQVAAAQQAATSGQISAFGWILAWSVGIVLLTIIARTRIGHAFLYYVFALFLLFLIVSNYFWIAQALAPFHALAQPAPAQQSGGG